MDDHLRQAAREVSRDPSLFLQSLDPQTRLRLFTAFGWEELIELLSSLDLDRQKLTQLNNVIQDMSSTRWYTVNNIDLRTATDPQLTELARLCAMHLVVPKTIQVPRAKHWLVRNFCYRAGLNFPV
jgi:hypothetical protein